MTQKSCPTCKPRGWLCCWANFVPGVGQGSGLRGDDGKVARGQGYDKDARPRVVNVNGMLVRWVLKRRKHHYTDSDEDLVSSLTGMVV